MKSITQKRLDLEYEIKEWLSEEFYDFSHHGMFFDYYSEKVPRFNLDPIIKEETKKSYEKMPKEELIERLLNNKPINYYEIEKWVFEKLFWDEPLLDLITFAIENLEKKIKYNSYQDFLGQDHSDEALEKARKKAEKLKNALKADLDKIKKFLEKLERE